MDHMASGLSKEEQELLRLERVADYQGFVDELFARGFVDSAQEFELPMEQVKTACETIGITMPGQLNEVLKSFKYRKDYSMSILDNTPDGKCWKIKTLVKKICFSLKDEVDKAKMYAPILVGIYANHYRSGITEFEFARDEIRSVAASKAIQLPANLGDLVYSFRYRSEMPKDIVDNTPSGTSWIIMGAGRGKYKFLLGKWQDIQPQIGRETIKILDDTPETIRRYTLKDEQACLARIRYNRLIDQFLGVKASSLQNHLRTFVGGIGQIEIDELYVGVDRYGAHHIIPVQAKVGSDKHSVVQTLQDSSYCDHQHPKLEKRCISAQYIRESYDDAGVKKMREIIVMFWLIVNGNEVSIRDEKRYLLVNSDSLSESDLESYRKVSRSGK